MNRYTAIRVLYPTRDLIRKLAEQEQRDIAVVVDRLAKAEWERRQAQPSTVQPIPDAEAAE